MEEMNIHQKILAARREIGYLQKDGKVAFGSTSYRAITDEKVMTTVRPILDKYGIVMTIDAIQMNRSGTMTDMVVTWRISDADDPDDYILIQSAGQGADTQDKGAGKAMTYSRKYALLNTLLIPTGEDTDRVASSKLNVMEIVSAELDGPQDDEASKRIANGRDAIVRLAKEKWGDDGSGKVIEILRGLYPDATFTKLSVDQLTALYREVKSHV